MSTASTSELQALLIKQNALQKIIAAKKIETQQELSTKFATPVVSIKAGKSKTFALETLSIPGGSYPLKGLAKWREGGNYPEPSARDNHDERIENIQGQNYWVHLTTLTTKGLAIGARAVTNRQYERFLQESKYRPRVPENHVKHWGGTTCPKAPEDTPVVYVSLEDARAFAL